MQLTLRRRHFLKQFPWRPAESISANVFTSICLSARRCLLFFFSYLNFESIYSFAKPINLLSSFFRSQMSLLMEIARLPLQHRKVIKKSQVRKLTTREINLVHYGNLQWVAFIPQSNSSSTVSATKENYITSERTIRAKRRTSISICENWR